MKRVYMKPLTEVVRVNCKNNFLDDWGNFGDNSNTDNVAGAREHNFLDEATIDEDAQPIFDRWKNPTWEE